MKRTTVYLPEELKDRLERAASKAGRTEAELIREGVLEITDRHLAPAPRLPLFNSGDPTLAGRVDELLAEGFGTD